jgi:hypothetical protein
MSTYISIPEIQRSQSDPIPQPTEDVMKHYYSTPTMKPSELEIKYTKTTTKFRPVNKNRHINKNKNNYCKQIKHPMTRWTSSHPSKQKIDFLFNYAVD